jgi:hypothetical protein
MAADGAGESGVDEEHGACTMCGEFCAYKNHGGAPRERNLTREAE